MSREIICYISARLERLQLKQNSSEKWNSHKRCTDI